MDDTDPKPKHWVGRKEARKHLNDMGETRFQALINDGLPRMELSPRCQMYDLVAIDAWLASGRPKRHEPSPQAVTRKPRKRKPGAQFAGFLDSLGAKA